MSSYLADRELLRTLAESQYGLITDPEVFGCWHVVAEAVSRGWLGRSSLDTLVAALLDGSGLGAEEYSMEVVPDGGPTVQVSVTFIDEEYLCSRDAMVHELRRLAQRYDGSTGGGPGSDVPVDPDAPVDPTAPDVLAPTEALVQLLLELGWTGGGTEAGDRVRELARAALADLERDPTEEHLAGIDEVVRGLAPQEQARLADGLGLLTQWLARPELDAGRGVDALVQAFERGLAPLLTKGRVAEERANLDRIHESARDSIARRLRESGAESSPEDY